MGTFRLDPAIALKEGKEQVSHAGETAHLTTEVFDLLEKMVQTGYTSPGAREIYAKLLAKKPILDSVAKTFGNYGTYLINTGSKTANVDQDIADGVKTS